MRATKVVDRVTKLPGKAGVRVLLTAVAVSLIALPSPSSADVTAVSGGAFGASASVGLFGGPPTVFPPTPTVTLPATGATPPITASAPSITFQVGPAQLLTTGLVTVSTQGTLGPAGSAISSATVQNPAIGGFTATTLSSTCTATETARTGSTTVTAGRLVTSDPNPNVEGDEVFFNVPANPAPNTSVEGIVPGVGDRFVVVFNEQIVTGNTITVNAAHFTLNGPNARGEVIIGQSRCGVTVVTAPTTTSSTTTTVPVTTTTSSTTTTVPVTTTTSPTTTTVPVTTTTSSTTTTRPTTTTTSPTTTTTQPPATTTTTRPTTTTVAPTTTSTTLVPPANACVARVQAAQTRFNAQIDRARAAFERAFGSRAGPVIARLERIRAQGNANFAAAIRRCPPGPGF